MSILEALLTDHLRKLSQAELVVMMFADPNFRPDILNEEQKQIIEEKLGFPPFHPSDEQKAEFRKMLTQE